MEIVLLLVLVNAIFVNGGWWPTTTTSKPTTSTPIPTMAPTTTTTPTTTTQTTTTSTMAPTMAQTMAPTTTTLATNTRVGVCNLPKDKGPCKMRLIRWYVTPFGRCRHFIYGGCRGNANNFKTRVLCYWSTRRCRCRLPKNPGPCKAKIRRFYYSKTQRKCVKFTYGGCGGNANNFRSRLRCQRTCGA